MPHARLAPLLLPLAAAVLATGAHAAPAPGAAAWILTCDMESAPGAHTARPQRIFRLAPQLFAEWQPETRSWGHNLCASFPCRADAGRLEGQISSATVVLTIRLDRTTGAGSWSAQGASGLTRPSGACTAEPEATARLPR